MNEPPPPMSSIHHGKVVAIQSFGAFVQMEGYQRHGLVHISQISNYRTDDINEVLSIGEAVWVKVLNITDSENGDKRISLSMKSVNQGDGADNDPNNVQYMLTQQKAKKVPQERKRIQLDSILPTTCSKCNCYGHLSSECKSFNTGTKYELLSSGDEKADPALLAAEIESTEAREARRLKKSLRIVNKAHKKEKKKEKSKSKEKKRRHSGSSSDDDNPTNLKQRVKKKKVIQTKATTWRFGTDRRNSLNFFQ